MDRMHPFDPDDIDKIKKRRENRERANQIVLGLGLLLVFVMGLLMYACLTELYRASGGS